MDNQVRAAAAALQIFIKLIDLMCEWIVRTIWTWFLILYCIKWYSKRERKEKQTISVELFTKLKTRRRRHSHSKKTAYNESERSKQTQNNKINSKQHCIIRVKSHFLRSERKPTNVLECTELMLCGESVCLFVTSIICYQHHQHHPHPHWHPYHTVLDTCKRHCTVPFGVCFSRFI